MHIVIAVLRKQPVNPTIPMKPLYWTRIIVPPSGQPAPVANRCVVFAVPTLYFLAGNVKASHRKLFCKVKGTMKKKEKFVFKRNSRPILLYQTMSNMILEKLPESTCTFSISIITIFCNSS
jgi:hypothetical protein